MKIIYTGSKSSFLDVAFFGPFGLLYAVEGTPTDTEFVWKQPNIGALTTVTGTGFTFDAGGNLTGGTITGLSFVQGGITVGQFKDFSWDGIDFADALVAADTSNRAPLEALFNAQPIVLNASGATSGFKISGFDIDLNTAVKFVGSKFTDVITTGASDDVLSGRSGGDIIRGGGGDDRISGGKGNDELFGGNSKNDIGNGSNKISGGLGRDSIYGENGRDRLVGGAGEDRILGAGGKDRIIGGGGRDYLYGGNGGDNINGGSLDDRIYGAAGRDKLFGDTGEDIIYGGIGNDILKGGVGDDYLYGGDGKDKISGGLGDDTMTGGNGADVFVFDGILDEGSDRINGFNDGTDLLRIIDATAANVVSIVASGTGNNNTTVTLDSGTKFTLTGVDVGLIGLDDFDFV
jgi:Ca2+-binding RTX toxin-like protein